MMVDLKVMAYFKISLSTRNWDRAITKGVTPVTPFAALFKSLSGSHRI
jgi:hypothetical protein